MVGSQPLPGSQARGVFVGRQRELEEMRAAGMLLQLGRGVIGLDLDLNPENWTRRKTKYPDDVIAE